MQSPSSMRHSTMRIGVLVSLLMGTGWTVHAQSGFGVVGEITDPQVRCAYEALDLKWARVIFRWPTIEPEPNVFDWKVPDQIVQTAIELGYNLLVTLEDTPAWANGGKPANFPPSDTQAWRQFVHQVVQRYNHYGPTNYTIRYWSIWNEPNLDIFFRGDMEDYIRKIFLPAAETIHGISRTIHVVGPEFSWHWILNTAQWNLLNFLTGPAGQQLDVMSLHVYNDAPAGFEGYLDQVVRPLLVETGWDGKPFWVTETGYPTCGGTCADDAQAHFLLRVINAQKRRAGWFKRVFFFSIFFHQPCNTLVLEDFTCDDQKVRPAYQALFDYLHGIPIPEFAPECHTSDPCAVRPPISPFDPHGSPPPGSSRTDPPMQTCGSS